MQSDKPGPTPNNFEDFTPKLNDEIISLMKSCIIDLKAKMNVSNYNNMFKNMFKSKKWVSKFNPLSNMQLTITIPNVQDSGRQGGTRSGHENHYHDSHYHLFKFFLIPKFKDIFYNITVKEDDKGFFFWCDNDRKLTTEEYCEIIDQVTTEYIHYFFQLNENNENFICDNNPNYKEAEFISEYEYCVLTLKEILDLGKGNNVWVVISYAALAVVSAMILSRLEMGWKPLSPTVVNNSYVTFVNVIFALSVVTSIAVKIKYSG